MPPNFGIKVILFQNSYLSVYYAATVLLRDIRASPDFPGRVLYNVPIVSFLTHSACWLSPFSSSKSQQPTPLSPKLQPYSKSSAPLSSYSSGLPRIHVHLDSNGDQRPRPRGMLSNSHSQTVSRYPIFPLSSNLFYSISRK